MSILDIKKYPDPVLRKKATPIEEIDEDLKRLAEDMAETMIFAYGIGLAAPQVGVSKRLIVVDFGMLKGLEKPIVEVRINPEIIEKSGTYQMEEGCLSLPGIREEVERASYIKVRSKDLDGREIVEEFNELYAVVFQHEIDHLDGIVFIDRLKDQKKAEIIKRRIQKYGYPDESDKKSKS